MNGAPGVSYPMTKNTLVAIFEDDVVSRYIYEKTFSARPQVSVYIFDHADEGIAKLQSNPVDVIFIEAHFRQNFGGIEILNKLRSSLNTMPVCIAITSLLQKGDLEKLMGAGFLMCLEKPIPFDEILGGRVQ